MESKLLSKNYTAHWKEGHATITEAEGYCVWSVSVINDKSKDVEGKEAKSKSGAVRAINRHLGFKPEFWLDGEITEDGIKQSKQQEWLEKWKKSGKKSLFV